MKCEAPACPHWCAESPLLSGHDHRCAVHWDTSTTMRRARLALPHSCDSSVADPSLLRFLDGRSAAAPTCQVLPKLPLHVCWNILGHRRAAWAVGDTFLSWDRFGFRVEERVWVVMDAFEAGEIKIAEVDYPHGLHLGPHAVVQLDCDGKEVDRALHELCTTRAVRHWVSRWRRAVHRRRALVSQEGLQDLLDVEVEPASSSSKVPRTC